MNLDWLEDGRKVPDDTMYYIRAMAVYAIRILGHSPEIVANTYNFNRSCIYRWLNQYDEGGFEALKSEKAPGQKPIITPEMDEWLKEIITTQTPVNFGYDTNLWTCLILVELLKNKFGIIVSESTVRLHLKKTKMSFQAPKYEDKHRDEREIANFLEIKFPKIQRLANKIGADIGFQDESGIGIMTRHGKTWGLKGKTPIVKVIVKRGGYNVLSIVTAKGQIEYSIEDGTVNGKVFVEFLRQLIQDREKPLILLVDHVSFHHSKLVRDFVRENRLKLRIYFLPKRAPEMNPDEQVWNEIKIHQIGKQPIKDKKDLENRLYAAFVKLKNSVEKIISFFQLKDTKYAYSS